MGRRAQLLVIHGPLATTCRIGLAVFGSLALLSAGFLLLGGRASAPPSARGGIVYFLVFFGGVAALALVGLLALGRRIEFDARAREVRWRRGIRGQPRRVAFDAVRAVRVSGGVAEPGMRALLVLPTSLGASDAYVSVGLDLGPEVLPVGLYVGFPRARRVAERLAARGGWPITTIP